MACRKRRCAQVTVAGSFIVPDSKPDIERIVRITSTPVITKTSTVCGKVIFTGCVQFSIEYVGKVAEKSQPIHYAQFSIPFSHFINHRHAVRDQEAKVSSNVEYQDMCAVNSRTISATVVVKVCILKLEISRCIFKSNTLTVDGDTACSCEASCDEAISCAAFDECEVCVDKVCK